MGMFGTSLEKLTERKDIPGLWKLYVKKKRAVGGDELCRYHDEAWDYAYELWKKKKAKQFDVLEFADLLIKKGKPYAGRDLVTPIEFQSKLGVAASMNKDSKGRCPVCKELLSSSVGGGKQGQYRVCLGCQRHYHLGCGETLAECVDCHGWRWRTSHRSRN